MTYDYEVALIGESIRRSGTNEIGDYIGKEVKRTVLAGIITYKTKAYYYALSSGLTPSISLAVNKYEYKGEEKLIFNKKTYRIIDVSPVTARDESEFESLVLLCEEMI